MAEWVTPIVDRTEADTVEAFNNQMIEAHLKGALNYSDLNRIENNYKYLIENLQKNGYYVNHKYRNYTETEPVVTKIEIPGEPGSGGNIVEPWIESTGTQYIDIGVKPNNNSKVIIDYSLDDTGTISSLFGARDDANLKTLGHVYIPSSVTDLSSLGGAKGINTVKRLSVSSYLRKADEVLLVDNSLGGLTANASFTLTLSGAEWKLPVSTVASDKSAWTLYITAGYVLESGLNQYILNKGYEGIYSISGVDVRVKLIDAKTITVTPLSNMPQGAFKLYMLLKTTANEVTVTIDKGTSSMQNATYAIAYSSNITNVFYYGGRSKGLSTNITGKHAIEVENGVFKLDGTVICSFAEETFTSGYPLYLCAFNKAGNGVHNSASTIYSVGIYENNAPVRDFIATLDDNNVACLYDKVEGKHYYNAGSGSFTYGENVYTPVEYIQSSGTQYVNTLFNPNYNTRVVLDADVLSTGAFLFGSRHNSSANSSTNSFCITLSGTTGVRTDFGGNEGWITVSSVLGRQIIEKNKKVTNYGGTSYTSTPVNATFQSNYPLYLLTVNTAGTIRADGTSAKIYSCQIYDNDVLVRDFIPVVNSSGVALLYDQLNGVPYYNAGTGSFVAGAVIPPIPPSEPTIEYVVEYIDQLYTEWFEQNIPWKSEFDRIRRNFNNLLKEYLYGKRISQVPYTQYFKFTEANKIEDISIVAKQLLENMIAEYRYCGTVNSGGDRLL